MWTTRQADAFLRAVKQSIVTVARRIVVEATVRCLISIVCMCRKISLVGVLLNRIKSTTMRLGVK